MKLKLPESFDLYFFEEICYFYYFHLHTIVSLPSLTTDISLQLIWSLVIKVQTNWIWFNSLKILKMRDYGNFFLNQGV